MHGNVGQKKRENHRKTERVLRLSLKIYQTDKVKKKETENGRVGNRPTDVQNTTVVGVEIRAK